MYKMYNEQQTNMIYNNKQLLSILSSKIYIVSMVTRAQLSSVLFYGKYISLK